MKEKLIVNTALTPTVYFGDGSIRLNTGFFDDTDCNESFISFTKQEPMDIGKMEHYCDPFELKNAGLIFRFSKIESIDALIESLEDAKRQFKAGEDK